MSSESSPAIEIRSLTKKYRDFIALNELDLKISRGEIFGFLGHNGAGKTTTVNLLTTLLSPTSGTATVAGFDVIRSPMEVRRRIGYLPENVKFYDDLTSFENLEYFARLSGIQKPASRIQSTLEFLEFTGFEKQKMGTFSKGMRQRIGIAQAILHEPEVLFLDEPTSGLDPMGVKNLREIILKLNREKGITLFINTHLLSEVARTCTTIGVLGHGKLIYHDTLSNTLAKFPTEDSLENIYLSLETAKTP